MGIALIDERTALRHQCHHLISDVVSVTRSHRFVCASTLLAYLHSYILHAVVDVNRKSLFESL